MKTQNWNASSENISTLCEKIRMHYSVDLKNKEDFADFHGGRKNKSTLLLWEFQMCFLHGWWINLLVNKFRFRSQHYVRILNYPWWSQFQIGRGVSDLRKRVSGGGSFVEAFFMMVSGVQKIGQSTVGYAVPNTQKIINHLRIKSIT